MSNYNFILILVMDREIINLRFQTTELWEVKGVDDLEGVTFAVCTSEDKAVEAEKLLKAQGFEDIKITKSNLNLDEIKIGEDTISF